MEKIIIFLLKLIVLLDVPEVFIAVTKEEAAKNTKNKLHEIFP